MSGNFRALWVETFHRNQWKLWSGIITIAFTQINIPIEANSLRFSYDFLNQVPGGILDLFINDILVFKAYSEDNYNGPRNSYWIDITSFSGTNAELTFRLASTDELQQHSIDIDNILFAKILSTIDIDEDGIIDGEDNCPHAYNPDQMDSNTNGIGDACDAPTLIKLTDFSATAKNKKIILAWITASEFNNAGFNLYRSDTKDGKYNKINAALIPAKGSSIEGALYEFEDITVKNRRTYYYRLEDIDLNGISTLHGPVDATPKLIYRGAKK